MKIGVDLGGSHIAVGLVDNEGNISNISQVDILAKDKNDIENFLYENLKRLINEVKMKTNEEIEYIGIASPGNPGDGKLKHIVNLGINCFDIEKKLKIDFSLPVYLRNDAKCAAIAENKFGALKKYSDSLFLCLGTGIGGAAIIDNKLLEPKRNSGCEFGHIVICKNGEVCRCGSRGCFEQYASMRIFKTKMKDALNIEEEISGEDLLKTIKDNLDNKIVQNVIDEFLEDLVIGISSLINIFEPEAVCIGGGFVYYREILFQKFQEKMQEKTYLFNKNEIPKIELAMLGNNAGIIGATII